MSDRDGRSPSTSRQAPPRGKFVEELDSEDDEHAQARRKTAREEAQHSNRRRPNDDGTAREGSSRSRSKARERAKPRRRAASPPADDSRQENESRLDASDDTVGLMKAERLKALKRRREQQNKTKRERYSAGRKDRGSTWRRIWTINGVVAPVFKGQEASNSISSWLAHVFRWRIFKWLVRQSPWMLIILDVIAAIVVGTTGMGWMPETGMLEGYGWFAYRDGYRLGAWGYCDDSWNCAVQRPVYDLRWTENPAVWYSSLVLSVTLLLVALGGVLLLISTVFWVIPLKFISSDHSYRFFTCQGCTGCVESALKTAIDRSDDKAEEQKYEDGITRDGKKAWMVGLEWLMWAFMVWIVVAFGLLKVWQAMAGAVGMKGDDVMEYLLGLALFWVIIWLAYRSDWACSRKKVYDVEEG